jgi:protein SCO1/2
MAGPRISTPVILITLCVAVGLGAWVSLQLREPSRKQLASEMTVLTLFPGERLLPELQLVDQDGKAVGRNAFTGHWSLVFMGFTSCGYICPTTMATLRMVQDQLEQPVQIVFVSVDPGRDKPPVIKEYVQKFDPGFIGMTGTPEQIAALAGTLGAPYVVNTDPDNYVVDHSSAVFLLSPDAGFAGVVTPPLEVDAIAADLNKLL